MARPGSPDAARAGSLAGSVRTPFDYAGHHGVAHDPFQRGRTEIITPAGDLLRADINVVGYLARKPAGAEPA